MPFITGSQESNPPGPKPRIYHLVDVKYAWRHWVINSLPIGPGPRSSQWCGGATLWDGLARPEMAQRNGWIWDGFFLEREENYGCRLLTFGPSNSSIFPNLGPRGMHLWPWEAPCGTSGGTIERHVSWKQVRTWERGVDDTCFAHQNGVLKKGVVAIFSCLHNL